MTSYRDEILTDSLTYQQKKNQKIEKIAIKREKVKTWIEEFLSNTGEYSYFYGGSRRFGWANELSDYDYFIHVRSGDVINVAFLLRNHFLQDGYDVFVGAGYEEGFINLKIRGHDLYPLADLNLTRTYEMWENLRLDHGDVEEFLIYNPWLRRLFARPGVYVSGKDKYRSIRDIIKSGGLTPYHQACAACSDNFIFKGSEKE